MGHDQNITAVSAVMTGVRAIFSLDEIPIGYAQNLEGSEEITYEPIDVLNNIFVQEHAPVGYRISLSAGFFRVPNASLKATGLFPKIANNVSTFLATVPMIVNVQDEVSNSIIAQIEGVKAQSKSFQVQARSTMGENVSFVGILMRDESEISG